jgi:uncharacterized protein GlcG (DUF336 family)
MSELTLIQANQLTEAALAMARHLNLPPIAVAVLDTGGHLKVLQREDGVSFLRVQVCQAKAWGALGLATNSRQIGERYNQDNFQQGFIIALNAMSGGGLIPLPGGVLIYDESGQITGAVGVSGAASDDDEACAVAGIKAIEMKTDLK